MAVLTFRNLLRGRPGVLMFVGVPAGRSEARAAQGLPAVYSAEVAALIDTGVDASFRVVRG
jgi:hypothetical protein